MNFLRLLVVFILPPVAVYMQFGADRNFWINCVLTLAGWYPGLIHAVYIMASKPPGLARLDRWGEQRIDSTR